jgi:uncharacterized protein (DUF924 family)
MTDDGSARLQAVTDFWLGAPDAQGAYRPRKVWFEKCAVFDAGLRRRHLADQEAAAAGAFDALATAPLPALALVILLDQVPRNIFRGNARSYATDAKALATAEAAIARGFDMEIHKEARLFFYTPFEHSEDLAAQARSLELVERRRGCEGFEFSRYIIERHHEIVARFGRFPHRNAVLGRETTPEEAAFLEEKHSAF